jgi:hypothetical protein
MLKNYHIQRFGFGSDTVFWHCFELARRSHRGCVAALSFRACAMLCFGHDLSVGGVRLNSRGRLKNEVL